MVSETAGATGDTVHRLETQGSIAVYRIYLQRVGNGAKGELYDAYDTGIDGEPRDIIVSRSRSPVLDAARLFRDLGVIGKLEVWRDGVAMPCVVADIQTAAGLTVIENGRQGPRFAPWKPFETQRDGIAIAHHPSERGAASALAAAPIAEQSAVPSTVSC